MAGTHVADEVEELFQVGPEVDLLARRDDQIQVPPTDDIGGTSRPVKFADRRARLPHRQLAESERWAGEGPRGFELVSGRRRRKEGPAQ